MKILSAPVSAANEVISFFNEHLSSEMDALYSQEFFCPDGLRAAIRKGQVLISVKDDEIVAAFRYYKRKTQQIISLYQFAISEEYRGQGLLQQMLHMIKDAPIEVMCPLHSSFNEYYCKTGWSLSGKLKNLNRWIYH